jgi:hypothetical protein
MASNKLGIVYKRIGLNKEDFVILAELCGDTLDQYKQILSDNSVMRLS